MIAPIGGAQDRMAPALSPTHVTAVGRPKILVLINSLGGGGSERSLVELIPYYRAEGFEPVLACLKQGAADLEGLLRAAGFQVKYLGGNGIPSWVWSLRKLIAREGVALIHSSLFEADVVGRLAAVGTGVPVLTSLVNMSYEPVRLSDPNVSRVGLHATQLIDGWTARALTTHFHAVTHAVRNSAIRALRIDPNRVTVVERGRDPERLGSMTWERRQSARRMLGLMGEDEVVVTVGRQEFQKGQKFLLHAFASILPRRPQLKLLVVGGPGHSTEELRALHQQLGLGDRAAFLGYREDVPEVLAGADIFVFPSLYEGTGGAVIEAMALGLPIVTSDIPSMREVVGSGESAILVPPGDPERLADAIVSLLSDRDKMKRLGRSGAKIFQERFTLARSALQMVELYRYLIAKGRA